jgi:lipopolysaccharide export system protein LptA
MRVKQMNKIRHILSKITVLVALSLTTIGLSTTAYAQSASGAFKGIGNNDDPIQIEADKLEIIDNQNTALLTGNVSVTQGQTLMRAKRIKVFYARASEQGKAKSGIRRIEASGKVAVRAGENKVSADKATINMIAETVLMTGNVVVSQTGNVLSACKVTVNLKTNVSKVTPCTSASGASSGRVKILLTPKN